MHEHWRETGRQLLVTHMVGELHGIQLGQWKLAHVSESPLLNSIIIGKQESHTVDEEER